MRPIKESEPLLFKIAPWFIGIFFVASWVVIGILAFEVFSEVGRVGLKALLEQIWCGKDGCK